ETEAVPKPLLSTVYDRSDGNPLFMVNITDYLIAREAIARDNGVVRFLITGQKDSVPETIRGLIERQVAALSPQDQELLEVGAVAGTTFSVAAIWRSKRIFFARPTCAFGPMAAGHRAIVSFMRFTRTLFTIGSMRQNAAGYIS